MMLKIAPLLSVEAKERQDTEIIPTKLINGKVNYLQEKL